jgi:hypothetical protein
MYGIAAFSLPNHLAQLQASQENTTLEHEELRKCVSQHSVLSH